MTTRNVAEFSGEYNFWANSFKEFSTTLNLLKHPSVSIENMKNCFSRFSVTRPEVEKVVYGKLWEIKGANDQRPDFGRHAFYDLYGCSSTREEKTQALEAYSSFLLSKEPIHFNSRFDPSKGFGNNEAVVTLIFRGVHASIAFDVTDENNQHVISIVDFVTSDEKALEEAKSNAISFGGASSDSKGHIRVLPPRDPTTTTWSRKSDSWITSKNKYKALIDYARNKNQIPTPYHAFGNQNWFNRVKEMLGMEASHNCITLALELFPLTGIHLGETGIKVNIYTDPNEICETDLKATNLAIQNLCYFAKHGATDAIRLNFSISRETAIPGSTVYVDINQVASDATVGPVESYLGKYTPLALAAAYGHLDTVKLLVDDYGADLTICSGRCHNYTALDCGNTNFWFSGVSKETRQDITKYFKERFQASDEVRSA